MIRKQEMRRSRAANLKLGIVIGGEERELDRQESKLPQCPWREGRVPRGRAHTRERKRLPDRSLWVSRGELAVAQKRRRCLRIPPTMVPSFLNLSHTLSLSLSSISIQISNCEESEWVKLSVGVMYSWFVMETGEQWRGRQESNR